MSVAHGNAGTLLLSGVLGAWLLFRAVTRDSHGQTLIDHLLGQPGGANQVSLSAGVPGSTFTPGAAPAGGQYTPQSWAQALLGAAALPVNATNVSNIVAWEAAEGGNWQNTARYNPLNTTRRAAGSVSVNPVGVQAYQSWPQGFQATLQTLQSSSYNGIIGALRRSAPFPEFKSAVASSPWGTWH